MENWLKTRERKTDMVEAKIYENGELQGSIEGNLLMAITKAGGDGQMVTVGEGSNADLLDMLRLIVQHVADRMGMDYAKLALMLMLAGKAEYEAERIDG